MIDYRSISLKLAEYYQVDSVWLDFCESDSYVDNAVYDRDFAKAKVLLTEFERKMFEVTE